MSEENKKRKRGVNFSPREVSHLFGIALKFKNIIENKQTNASANSDKNEAWEKISREFNATSTDFNNRSIEQLKRCYENKKQTMRKKRADLRMETIKTGGGLPKPVPKDDLDDLVLATMDPLTVVGHTAPHDSDFDASIETPNQDSIEYVFESCFEDRKNTADHIVLEVDDNENIFEHSNEQDFGSVDLINNWRSESWPQKQVSVYEPRYKPTFSSCCSEVNNQPCSSTLLPSSPVRKPASTINSNQNQAGDSSSCLKENWKNYNTNDFKRPTNPALLKNSVESDTRRKSDEAKYEEQVTENKEKETVTKSPKINANEVRNRRTVRGRGGTYERGRTGRASDRRRPTETIVRTLASNTLAEKYEALAEKKNIIADHAIKKIEKERLYADEEHDLRKKCLELEIKLKRKQLGNFL